MKRLIFLLLPVLCFGQMQEQFAEVHYTTSIQDVGVDTSDVFDLFSVQSVQYAMIDTTTDDSTGYSLALYICNQNKTSFDSTFTLAKTLETNETTAEWQPTVQFDTPVALKGCFITTGTTDNNVETPNLFYLNIVGWSNAEGMSRRLR